MTTPPNDNNLPGDDPTRPLPPNAAGDDLAPDAQREEQVKIAADILGLSVDKARERHSIVEGTAAIYVQGSEGAVIVAPDRTHLFAHNDVSKQEHVRAFWDGQRGNYVAPEEVPVEEEKSNGAIWAVIGVLALALIGLLVWLFAFADDEDEEEPTEDPTETTAEESPTPEPTEEVQPPVEEEAEEPAPTETETETVEPEEPEPAPTPTEEEEEEDPFDPSNASVNIGGVFVEDEPTEVSGSGFMPGESVDFYIEEVDLGSATADPDGDFEADVVINGPFSDQETTLYIDGQDSGIELEETITLEGSLDEGEE